MGVSAVLPPSLYVEAWLLEEENKEDPVYEIALSAILRPEDPEARPAFEYLETVCSVAAETRVEEKPDMMFGKANVSTYTVFRKCPGKSVEHQCGKEVTSG